MIPIVSAAEVLPADVAALMADILGRGSAVRMRVTGRSMFPLLPSGATVTVRPVDSETLRPGDILLFQNNLASAVLHRIVRVDVDPARGKMFRTKGDAVMAFDDPVSPGQILGRAVRIERPLSGGRYWAMNLDTRHWRWAGAIIARLQLIGAKVLMTLAALGR